MIDHPLPQLSEKLYEYVNGLSNEISPGFPMSDKNFAWFVLLNDLPTHSNLLPRFMPRYRDFDSCGCLDYANYSRPNYMMYVPSDGVPWFSKLARYNYSFNPGHGRNAAIHQLTRTSAGTFLALVKQLQSKFLFKPSLNECALTKLSLEYLGMSPPRLLLPANVPVREAKLDANLMDEKIIDTYFDACYEYDGFQIVLILQRGRRKLALHDAVELSTRKNCAVRKFGKQGLVLQPFDDFVEAAKYEGWWRGLE